MIIDTHCHLHSKEFFHENRESVYQSAVEAEVGIILASTSEEDSVEALKFAKSHKNCWALVGVHPHDSRLGYKKVEDLIRSAPEELVGIGEIGLDFHYNNSSKKDQIAALEQQLQWAVDYNLPVSFHVRDAFDDFWPVFDNFFGVRGVLHSFTDTVLTLDKALAKGLYVGVNGISTFTKDIAQQAMFLRVPLERMLLETDAPFLTPSPFRGKVNSPAYVGEVAKHQARIRGLRLEDIISQTTINTRNLFIIN